MTTTSECTSDDTVKESFTMAETSFMTSDHVEKFELSDVGANGVVSGDVSLSRDVDRGWAWVVLVASCLSVATQEAIFSMSGMFQVEFQASFESSRGLLALIGAIFLSTTGILGPLAGVLSTELTPRVALMLGGACTSLALVVASFVHSTTALLLTYGLLGGFGNALIFTPATTAFSSYFLKYRQVANGFIMAAPGVGILGGPFLARWLLDWLGWRHSLVVCGFLTSQTCILAALIFPLPGTPRTSLLAALNKIARRGKGMNSSFATKRQEVKSNLPDKHFGDALLEDCGREDDARRGMSMRQRLQQICRSREVWILCVNQMMMMSGYNVHLLHQAAYLHSIGLDGHHYPNLHFTFGACMTAIRVGGGFVFHRFTTHLIPAMFVCEMTMALCMALMPFYALSLPGLYVYNVLAGLSYGPSFMLATPVLIDYTGVDSLPIAFGILLCGCGSASVVVASFAGFLYDVVGTYKASFFLGGSLVGGGALMLLLLLCVGRRASDRPVQMSVPVQCDKEH